MQPLELVDEAPVGGALAVVEQPGRAEQEGARADAQEAGAARAGPAQGGEHRLGRGDTPVVGGDGHEVGVLDRAEVGVGHEVEPG